MKNPWRSLLGYFVGVAVLSALVMLIPAIGGPGWMPESLTREARRIDALFWGTVVVGVVILAAVMAIVLYSVANFRVRPGDEEDGEPIHGHHRLEVVWTIIPAIIVTVIAAVSYVVLVRDEAPPARGDGLTVEVRAFQFGWDFTYPKLDVAQASNLVLPVDRTALFNVMSCSGREQTGSCASRAERLGLDPAPAVPQQGRDDDAGDVLHGFWVPEARIKIDAVPGIKTRTQWTPEHVTGPDDRWQVVCAELCGSGHGGMRTDVCVVDAAAFDWWGKHPDTRCDVLRYFNCADAGSDHDALAERAKRLVADDPDATCDDLEEVTA